jgi:hypothetical protein
MTGLEQKLASILESIEHARAARDALALAVLLQRKDTICAALAAPEHCWHAPDGEVSACIVQLEPAKTVALVA